MARERRTLKDPFETLADKPSNSAELGAERRPSEPVIHNVGQAAERATGGRRTVYSESDSIVELVKSEQPTALFDQEYARNTLYLRHDVRKEVDRLARKQPKGFKTRLINYAIAKVLRDEFDIRL